MVKMNCNLYFRFLTTSFQILKIAEASPPTRHFKKCFSFNQVQSTISSLNSECKGVSNGSYKCIQHENIS